MRFPITLTYCIMGLIVGTMVMENSEFRAMIPLDKPDLMIPVFIKEYLPHGIIGILLVAIFSAAISSLSSTINSLSAATVEDFFNRNKKLDDGEYMKYSKIAAIFWGVVCIVLAFFTGDIAKTVIEAINKIGSVFYGPIFATFIAAIGIKRTNFIGANAGLLIGVGVNVYLWLYCPEIFWFWWNAIGTVVTLVVSVIVSMIFSTEQKHVPDYKSDEGIDISKALILIAFTMLIIGFSYLFPKLF